METLTTIQQAVQRVDWLISIDLKDAYFHILMAKNVRKYLQFQVRQEHMQFTCLSFVSRPPHPGYYRKFFWLGGPHQNERDTLVSLPRRSLGVIHSQEQLLAHKVQVTSILVEFGWLLNQKKKNRTSPVLGILRGSVHHGEEHISLPIEKIPVIRERISLALSFSCLKASRCLRIISMLVSSTQ